MDDEIRRFVLTSVPSVPYLEALLLMRSDESAEWDSARLARRLYLSDKAAASLLSELHEAGIAAETGVAGPAYRYAPSSDSLRHIINLLADAYAAHLVDITNLIHSTTSKKAKRFADAFRWRKDS